MILPRGDDPSVDYPEADYPMTGYPIADSPTTSYPTAVTPQRSSNSPTIPEEKRMARSGTMCSCWRMFIGSNLASDAPFGAPPIDPSHYSVRSSAADSKECQSQTPGMSAAANTAAHESIQYGDTY